MKKSILKPASQPKNDGTIKWDEKTIEEHDKERGQYPKITEPKTPFSYENGEGQEEDHEEEKTGKLIINAQNVDSMPSSLKRKASDQKEKLNLEELNQKLHQQALEMGIDRNDLLESDEEEEKNKKKHQDFKKKRAAHYNEFQHIKSIKKEKKNFPEVEEEDK